MASIKQSINSFNDKTDARELRRLFADLLADLTALRTAHVVLAAKLDADVGVTDINYGALTNPVALTITA